MSTPLSRIHVNIVRWSGYQTDSSGHGNTNNMSSPSVLIISDRNDSILNWVEAFRQRGLDAASTASPALAQRYWLVRPPLLTVIDLSLPFEGVLQICRSLRAISDAPILLVLPSAHGDEILEAWSAGATECLVQPDSPAVILLKALAWSMRAGLERPVAAPVWSMSFAESS